ncbi:cell cycle regulator of non-homologous end joining [Acanthochromis polyacanthus]|uniref:cell cycle regulator of non-homologous end joining n=1 Tax=Acanthochromis polyacanthus TaxID=80966 RepID=UPI002234B7CB|nr:cell cycle regulator of non-homologous end joining [Acanthochromis polyacanthus]
MSEKRRALPVWMEKKQKKVKEPLKSKRKRKTARSAFYCMNEEELLEAAVSCLTSGDCEDAALRTDQQVEQKAVDTVKKKRKPAISHMTAKRGHLKEESSDGGDDPDMTYVSETDLDITEVEMVPYTTSPQHPGSTGQRSEPVQDHTDLDAEKRKEQPQEDDALRLVREIFFT